MSHREPATLLAQPDPPPRIGGSWALTTLALLGVTYTLYYARDFLLPVVLALLLALLLSPLVQALRRAGLPHVLGSALVSFGLVALIVTTGLLLRQPAWEWIQQAPQVIRDLEFKVAPLQQTVAEVNEAASQVENMTQNADEGPPLVRIQGESLRDVVLAQAQVVGVGAVMTVFLLFFMLSSGELMLRNVMTALPSWRDKRRTLEIARHLQREISAYLFTFTLINMTLAAVTALALYLVGMPNPVLWGVMAGMLNYIPYLGPAVTLTVLSLVSALSFSTLDQILLGPLLFLVATSLEGQLITPLILGRRLALNPIVIFLGLIFWGWLWGVVGALLAVPIMVTIKIVCDHVEPLHPVGIALGR